MIVATATPAAAEMPVFPPPETWPRNIVGFRMHGDTKVTNQTAEYLSHFEIGEPISPEDVSRLEQAFLSSELFEGVTVRLEGTADGVLVHVYVEDKHSWIVAPTIYWLPGKRAFGVGFAENNWRGLNQKVLLYGQVGTRESMFFGTHLTPSVRGTPLVMRYDLFLLSRIVSEYANEAGGSRGGSTSIFGCAART
jgi:outer membrane protein assembly factor BamA